MAKRPDAARLRGLVPPDFFMLSNLRELAGQAIGAMHEGEELPDDFFDKLSALTPAQKNEVAQALHDYSVEQLRCDHVASELLEEIDL